MHLGGAGKRLTEMENQTRLVRLGRSKKNEWVNCYVQKIFDKSTADDVPEELVLYVCRGRKRVLVKHVGCGPHSIGECLVAAKPRRAD